MSHEAQSGLSIEELLRRARAGDEDALEELFNRCRPKLGHWVSRGFVRAQPGATRTSDIVQDTALRAFHKFSRFKGTTEAEWLAWLQRILRNQETQAFRNARRVKREPLETVPLDSPEALATPTSLKSPSQTASHHEEWRQLLVHLYQLPDDQRDAIWLCYLKEFPVADSARRLGKTEGAVAGLLQRGLKTLRARMVGEQEMDAPETVGLDPVLNDAATALLDYLRRRDAGEKVDSVAFTAEHPTCAEELHAMLHWIERLQALRPSSPHRSEP